MIEFNFFTPLNLTGYGVVGQNISKALIKQKYNFNLYSIGNPSIEDKSIKDKLDSSTSQFTNYIPSVYHWHAHDLHSFSGSPRIGFTVFELDSFSSTEKNELDNCERIIVPTEWARDIVLKETSILAPEDIDVLNFGCDLSLYNYHEKDYINLKNDRIRLLNVGKFEVRKGHYNLAEALLKIDYSNVDLIAHWFNPFMKPEIIIQYLFGLGYKVSNQTKPMPLEGINGFNFLRFGAPNGNSIYLSLDYNPNVPVVNELSKICDIGIYPARAEGWNLPLHESMCCGLPCIVTNYSGHTEYVDHDNSIVMDIDYSRLIKANDGMFFRGKHGSWLYYTTQDLVNVINDTLDIKNKTKLQIIHKNLEIFREKYTWDKTAQQLIQIVRQSELKPF